MRGRWKGTAEKSTSNGGFDTHEDDDQVSLLHLAVERTRHEMSTEIFVPHKFHPRNAIFEPDFSNIGEKDVINKITILLTRKPAIEDISDDLLREAYSLSIPSSDRCRSEGITVKAQTAIGGMHALQTLYQLFYTHSSYLLSSTSSNAPTSSNDTFPSPDHGKPRLYTALAPIVIYDYPAFSHRGLNLDISRHPISPAAVTRTISALALTKLNKLHLHASDAQSWPLYVPSIPSLAENGAYSKNEIWSVEDLEYVQQYGYERGVEVYLETDSPGHMSVVGNLAKSPVSAEDSTEELQSLVVGQEATPWWKYAAEPPAGQLSLNDSAVTAFLTKLFDDLIPRSTQFSKRFNAGNSKDKYAGKPLFHFGGDEVNRNIYSLDPRIRSTSKSVLRPLLQEYTNHLIGMARKYDVTPVFWEEMLLDWDLDLPADVLIQTWRGENEVRDYDDDDGCDGNGESKTRNSLAEVTRRGHRALFGANSHWYLDCGHGLFLDEADDSTDDDDNHGLNTNANVHPKPAVRPPYTDYCAPYKNWRHVYAYNPLADLSTYNERNQDSDQKTHSNNNNNHNYNNNTNTNSTSKNDSKDSSTTHDPTTLILGGEVHLWTELTDTVTLDSMLWPRAAAAAEVMWGRRRLENGGKKDHEKDGAKGGKHGKTTARVRVTEGVTRRLAELRERLVHGKGVGAAVVQMEWCLRRRGGCVV